MSGCCLNTGKPDDFRKVKKRGSLHNNWIQLEWIMATYLVPRVDGNPQCIHTLPPQKFNSEFSPEKLPNPTRKPDRSSSGFPPFRGELFNFGGWYSGAIQEEGKGKLNLSLNLVSSSFSTAQPFEPFWTLPTTPLKLSRFHHSKKVTSRIASLYESAALL